MNKGPMDGAREPCIMGQWIDQRVIEGAMDQLAIVAIEGAMDQTAVDEEMDQR